MSSVMMKPPSQRHSDSHGMGGVEASDATRIPMSPGLIVEREQRAGIEPGSPQSTRNYDGTLRSEFWGGLTDAEWDEWEAAEDYKRVVEAPAPIAGDPAKSVAKETNPKDAVGIKKVPFSTVPAVIVAEIGLGMLEGARKYRRHNYRVAGVRASVYYDATMRHLTAWWEGQEIDPASGLPHIIKAMSSLAVLRDAQLNNKCEDDRPPPMLDQDWVEKLSAKAGEIIERYPEYLPPYTRADVVKA